MKETERVRGGDVVGGRLSHMTSVYVFSPGRGEQPLSQHSLPSGGPWIIPLDLVIGIAGINGHSRYQNVVIGIAGINRHSRYQNAMIGTAGINRHSRYQNAMIGKENVGPRIQGYGRKYHCTLKAWKTITPRIGWRRQRRTI